MHRNKVSATRLFLLLLLSASLPSACSREESTSDIDPPQRPLMGQSAGLEPAQMTSPLTTTPPLPDLTPPRVQTP